MGRSNCIDGPYPLGYDRLLIHHNRDHSTICTRPSANFANTRAQSSNASADLHSDTGANSHVTPDLEAMNNSEAYYGDDALHVGNGNGLHILNIGSSKFYSPQKMFSLKNILHSSNGQSSPISTTSIPTPPPPTPPPPPPPITQQCPENLCQNLKQRVPYNPSANHATVLPTTITEPTSFIVANNSPEWRQAMKEEYDALMKNGIFVAKGFRQQPGIDFHETFILVVKSITIRAVLSLTVTNNWPLCQLDVHNAFLHGNLKERVYMKQPLGFIDPQRQNHLFLLHKSLYGLKQAPRPWFERRSKALFDLGFKGSKTDPSLFIYSRGHTLLNILVYVDDIIVTGNNKGTIDNIISQLGSAFALKDLGPLNYILGIEIVPHVSDILLSQKKYILELLQSVGLSNCNPVSSPMVTSSPLSLNDGTAFSNPVKYRQVVGFLQYVTLSRPDIAFTVNKVCNPNTSLEAFLDAVWTGDLDDRRSIGGFAIYLGANLISWTARKQCTVSRSSTEAGYKALDDTVAELTWL
ncbi:putative RNA-directed DNA polymerase [Tanacetum coccineum]